MKTIPFDIKYRPEIESGKYKVTLDVPDAKKLCGRVLAWNLPGDYPIAVATWFTDDPNSCCVESYTASGDDDMGTHLIIITDEPELTEFEEYLKELVNSHAISHCRIDDPKIIRHYAAELIDLARKELCPGCGKFLKTF